MASLRQRIITLFPLLLLIFIDDMGNALFYPLLPPILLNPLGGVLPAETTEAVRQFDYGLVLAIFPFMMFLSAPILGDLSDIYGRKKVLIVSLIGTIFGYLVTAMGVSYQNFGLLLFGRALDGLTAGNFPIAQAAIIDLSEPEQKAENISLLVFAISLGFIFGPMMSAVLSSPNLLSWFNLATPLYAASLFGLVNLIMIFFLFNDTNKPRQSMVTVNIKRALDLFLDAFRHQHIRYLSMLLLFLLLGWGTYIQYVSAFLYKEYHISDHAIAGFNVLMAISFAVSSMVIIRILLTYWSNAVITCMALAISCVGALLTVLTDQALYAWIGLIPLSVGIAISHTTIITLYSDEVDNDHQGWVMGVTSSVMSVAITVSALIDGMMGNFSVRSPLWLALGFYIIATLLSCYRRQSISDSKP